jgi:hypothetical protein
MLHMRRKREESEGKINDGKMKSKILYFDLRVKF